MLKKVVISGGTGMIGLALTNQFIKMGVKVLLLIKSEFVKPGTLPINPLVQTAEFDLNNVSSFDFVEHDFDAFIHLGWVSTIGAGRDDAELQEKNIKITLECVRLAKKLGCTMFMGAGSQAEYGPKEEKLTCNLACNPESGYGIAKFSAGKLSRILANQLGMRHCWVRILSIYGPNDNPRTLISYTINSLLKGERPSFTKCEQDWDYLFVEDCAYALACVADKGVNGKTYPIGCGKTLKLYEYLNTIKKIIGSNIELGIGEKDYPPHQPMYLCAEISELEKDTGYKAQYTFESGITKTIEYYKKELGL